MALILSHPLWCIDVVRHLSITPWGEDWGAGISFFFLCDLLWDKEQQLECQPLSSLADDGCTARWGVTPTGNTVNRSWGILCSQSSPCCWYYYHVMIIRIWVTEKLTCGTIWLRRSCAFDSPPVEPLRFGVNTKFTGERCLFSTVYIILCHSHWCVYRHLWSSHLCLVWVSHSHTSTAWGHLLPWKQEIHHLISIQRVTLGKQTSPVSLAKAHSH